MKRFSIQWGCALAALMVCGGVARGQINNINPPALPSGEVGVPYTAPAFTAIEGGIFNCCTWTSTLAPTSGLSISSGGVISGTPSPSAAPSVQFTVTAMDSGGNSLNAGPFSISIASAPTVTTTSLNAGEVNVAYTQTLSASGGSGSGYTWSPGNPPLPAGLSLSPAGVVSGTPTATGSFTFGVQVTDSAGGSGTGTISLVINPGPTITTGATLPNGEVNAPYSQTLAASGGTGMGFVWSPGSPALPAWLALSAGGTLTGTPTTAGGVSFGVKVTDSAGGFATQVFTITVNSGPNITTAANLPNGEVGAPYSQTLAASGGSGAGFTWSAGAPAPPAWLSISAGGLVSGTPTAAGPISFGVKVTDSVGGFGTQVFSLTVNSGPNITTGATLPAGETGASYTVTLNASGGSGSGYTWALAGGSQLPAGLSLNSGSGTISGTPTASGPFSFTIQVTDSLGGSGSQAFSLTVNPGPTITTAPTLPNGTVNVAYTPVTLAAINGTGPGTYTWSITQGAPPTGINLDGASGTISGTPTSSGTATFSVQVSDAKSVTSTKQFTLTVAAGLTITTAPTLPNGTIGQPYTLSLQAAGGTGPFSFQVTSGSLPGGMNLATSGALTGTPTANGTFNFTVTVTDSNSVTANKVFTLTVASGLTITNAPTLPSGTIGNAYSQTLTAAGGTSPYTFSVTGGALPGGLNLSPSSGTISGSPTAGGTFTFTVTVTDSASVTAAKSFSISIAALLAISTQPALPSGGVGTPYSQGLTAVGGTSPYTWQAIAGSLPGGLTLSPSSGTISGTPTSVGNFSFTVQVTDNNSFSTTKAFTLSIVSALTITTQPTLPGGAVGVAYAQSIVVVGGNAPYTWSITSGSLPAGLTLAPSSGAISGSPTSAGDFTFTVQVTDSASVTVNKAFSMTVVAGLAITTAPVLPSDSIGVSYTVTLAAAGGAAPYTFAVTAGGLPGGLALDAKSGSIFGTPTASGSFNFTVKVTDNASNTATKQFSIAVAAGLIITTAPVLPNGAIGATYSQPLNAAGGSAPYSWSIKQGSLPGGVSLDPSSGLISGAPAAAGPYSFTVQVTDSASATATKLFSLDISASLSITTPPALPNGSVGVPYSITLGIAGGTPPYQWAANSGGLPAGLALDPSSGTLAGTPTSAGTFTFVVTVTDGAGHQASQQFNLTVAAGLVIATTAQLPAGSVGSQYSQTLNAAGGTPPYRWSVTSGTLPAGIGLSPGGVVSGIPTANGTFKFTVKVTDNTGATASLQFSLTIGSGLTVTSGATLPAGTLGQPYTPLALAAAGGRQPYSWSVTAGNIAPGLTLAPDGTISGTPTSAGPFTFTVQVTDANGATATLAVSIAILPPALPQVSINGLPETSTSAQQISFGITLTSPYPLDITGTASLTFKPDAVAAADDPAIQFSTGGDTASFKISAGKTSAVFSAPQIALQTGTVAGTITVTFALDAGGSQLVAIPRTITIARSAPVITAVKIVKGSNSFQVEVTGYSSPRELTEADLTFTPTAGSTLQTTSAIIDLSAVGKQWFSSTQSAQFGSQYILVLPFTATQGNISAVASVSVILKNSTAASASASANF